MRRFLALLLAAMIGMMAAVPAAAAEGSSPHSRGNTLTVWLCLPVDEDHPRIRGEHPHQMYWIKGRRGSSPHSRGTQTMLCTFGGVTGIIPASAGNTINGNSKCTETRDHPRIRGEHRGSLTPCGRAAGSSPHPRGTQIQFQFRISHPGIIPASAGNTC